MFVRSSRRSLAFTRNTVRGMHPSSHRRPHCHRLRPRPRPCQLYAPPAPPLPPAAARTRCACFCSQRPTVAIEWLSWRAPRPRPSLNLNLRLSFRLSLSLHHRDSRLAAIPTRRRRSLCTTLFEVRILWASIYFRLRFQISMEPRIRLFSNKIVSVICCIISFPWL